MCKIEGVSLVYSGVDDGQGDSSRVLVRPRQTANTIVVEIDDFFCDNRVEAELTVEAAMALSESLRVASGIVVARQAAMAAE